jgi:hypothetical protein
MGVGRKHGHVVSEGLETLDVFEGPFSGLLVEDYGQYLQVVIAEGVHSDIELVLAEGDAGLVEHHEQFFEAIEIGEQLGTAMDDAQLMVALLFHLKGQHLCAQSEVALRLQQPLLFTTVIFFAKVFVPVVKADLPSSGTIRRLSLFEGTASEAGIDGHLAVLATVLGSNLWAFYSVHVLIL